MSRQVRHRMAAVLLGGLLLGAPLLTNGTASAEQTGRAPMPIPTCDLDRQAAPIQAAGRARGTDRQFPPRRTTTTVPTPAPPADYVDAADADSDSRAGLATKPDPSAPSRSHTKAANPNPTKVRIKPVRGTGSSAPASLGKPPGDGKDKAHGVPTLDFPPPPDSAPAAAAATPRKIAHVAAAAPVATVEPAQGNGPIGLLGMVAIVCVLGAGVTLIRAIVSQRAYRTNIA